MASRAHPPVALVLPVASFARHGLWIAVGAAILVRLAALALFAQPPASDGLGYFTMARSLAETGAMVDQFGQRAFYSPGYALLLAPFFALFGASAIVGHIVNLLLAGATTALVWRLARELGGGRGAAALAGLGYAAWLPAIWQATDLARENLSTPLLVGFAIVVARIARGARGWRNPVLAGTLFGAGLLAGTSVVLTASGFVAAVLLGRSRQRVRPLALFAAATLAVLTPWLAATTVTLGRPVLTTNAGFNLYIGNNPAADGHFVTIPATPAGDGWQTRRETLGELGTADWLSGEARAWIVANPVRAGELAVKKLALFWAPNIPDQADVSAAPLVAGLRVIDLAQWAAILLLAGAALGARTLDTRVRWSFAALIAGFWLVHAATYVIARYREPVMPILIALAALEAARRLQRYVRR